MWGRVKKKINSEASTSSYVACLSFFNSLLLLTEWCRRKCKTSPAVARSAVSKIPTTELGKFDDVNDDDDDEVATADERIRSTNASVK